MQWPYWHHENAGHCDPVKAFKIVVAESFVRKTGFGARQKKLTIDFPNEDFVIDTAF